MKQDVATFVGSCLHCLATALGTTVPSPISYTMHASEPNTILHFDFCYISAGEEGMKYVLVMKNDFSGYVWFKSASETTEEVTVDCLID